MGHGSKELLLSPGAKRTGRGHKARRSELWVSDLEIPGIEGFLLYLGMVNAPFVDPGSKG